MPPKSHWWTRLTRPKRAWNDLESPYRYSASDEDEDEDDIPPLPTRGTMRTVGPGNSYWYSDEPRRGLATKAQIDALRTRASSGRPLFDGIRVDPKE